MSEAAPIPKGYRTAVFGGGNGWGKRIAETVSATGADVFIVEINDTKDSVGMAIDKSDAIFLATPDTAIDALLLEWENLLTSKILLDCATNKSDFSETLKKLATSGARVCSTHPMAGSMGVLRGQNALIMPVGENATDALRLAHSIYSALGMRCHTLDFDKHTQLMAAVQMLPHVVQRISIDALAHALEKLGIGIGDLADLASANYQLAELGLGRVAAQRPDISAGIIETAMQDDFGRQVLDMLKQSLQQIDRARHSRLELQTQFAASTQRLDPDGQWRADMATQSEAALIRLGNLRSRSLTIEAPNRIGMLRDILIVLANHRIDMTALDSRLIVQPDGSERVFFDIAISNNALSCSSLTEDLRPTGARLTQLSDTAS